MYGHVPFYRNFKLRPDKIKVLNLKENEDVYKIANQFYYRTKALYNFLKTLKTEDSQSIILIISDHLPPIFKKSSNFYKYDLKTNIALLLINFKPYDISGVPYYQIPHIIWRLLGGKEVKLNKKSKKELQQYYLTLMAQGIGVIKIK
jgi:phosphoglycerol transferase MdoB-like AlkP superfamily enzyme